MIFGGWIAFGICVIAFLAMWIMSLMGIDWRQNYYYLAFSFPLFLFVILFLPIMYVTGKKYKKGEDRLAAGSYLAHWQFQEQDWNRFIAIEWRRQKRKAFTTPFGFIALFIIMGLLAKGISADDLGWIVLIAFAIGVLISALILIVGRSTHRKLSKGPREVFIAPTGVSIAGRYAPWDVVGTRLGGVKHVAGDPAMLEFEYVSWGRGGSRTTTLRVPIPLGRDQEAQSIVSKLANE